MMWRAPPITRPNNVEHSPSAWCCFPARCSGLALLEGAALSAMLRGAQIKLLTTDYLGVTEPEALERLASWQGRLDVRVYSHPRRSFHPKAYLFERSDGSGRAFIGSSNLSRSGLVEGVEWTWSVLDVDAGQPMHELTTRFEELFADTHSAALTPEWIRAYAARRSPSVPTLRIAEPTAHYRVDPVEPRDVQRLALMELERLRSDGHTRALVVAATGLGKTMLAAFDARDADRVLFIAHREELLRQAEASFKRLYPARSSGFAVDGRQELDCDMVFASIQTLARVLRDRPETLGRFDYVVVDEFHHAAADSYQKVLEALQPRFLLGLTATPYRGDNRDILQLCHGNLAFQVGLLEAIGFGWLVPFHYRGVADVVAYTDDLLTARKVYDTEKLTLRFNTAVRAALVIAQFRAHAAKATLGFCVSIAHANFMAEQFTAAGLRAAAVHSGTDSMNRSQAIQALAQGRLQVLFTVDLFNEGVDIPEVDLVMFLRPTESMTIFLQQLGRGLRLHPSKTHLTVIDFIGNYRNAHLKVPLLVGQDVGGEGDVAPALRALTRWAQGGSRPDTVPDGIEVTFEPVALATLRDTLQKASPLKHLVLAELEALQTSLGHPPELLDWERLASYSFRTAKTALQVDRWHSVLRTAGMANETDALLDDQVGGFLKAIETTAMTKSFKMVVLLAMVGATRFQTAVSVEALVQVFRQYFSLERHRPDVMGSPVEDAPSAEHSQWVTYLEANPIHAWTTPNTQLAVPWLRYDRNAGTLRYMGPQPAADLEQAFAQAVRDRVLARLEGYWRQKSAQNHVFAVVPTGERRMASSDAEPAAESAADPEPQRSFCIMFGNERASLPTGWRPVTINGKSLYGKFVKVALNVLKAQPTDDRSVPNQLTEELRDLFGGRLHGRCRVRVVKEAGAAAWTVLRA